MRSVCYAITIGLLILASSCSRPAKNSALDPIIVEKELRALEIAHKTAIDSKDIEGILQCYSSDLITISPGEPIRYGKEWILTTLNDLYETYDFHEDFKFIDIKIIGDRVAASYSFTQQMIPLAGGEKIENTGKGLCILKQYEMNNWQFEWNAYYTDNMDASKKE